MSVPSQIESGKKSVYAASYIELSFYSSFLHLRGKGGQFIASKPPSLHREGVGFSFFCNKETEGRGKMEILAPFPNLDSGMRGKEKSVSLLCVCAPSVHVLPKKISARGLNFRPEFINSKNVFFCRRLLFLSCEMNECCF